MIGKKIAQLEALKIKLKILHDKIAKKFMMQRKEVMDSYAEMIKKSGSSKYADELTLKRNIKINQLLKKEEKYASKAKNSYEAIKNKIEKDLIEDKKNLKSWVDYHNGKVKGKPSSRDFGSGDSLGKREIKPVTTILKKAKKFGKGKFIITAAIISGLMYAGYIKYKKIENEKINKLKQAKI